MKKVILTVSAFIFSLKLMAQAPEKMSYQAVVRNSSNGLVISAPVGMRISILQGSASGASVYTETHTANSNANGLVSLEIGSGTVVSGNFSTIDWSADTYFIQTETDPTGGTTYTVTGTSQLMSVPYALHAKTAETVINNNDADADPTNELQNWTNLPGIPSDIADGDDVDDADADPANEIELPVGGTNGQVLSTDGTGNYSWVNQPANELPVGGTNAQVLSTDGTGNYSWVNQTVNNLPNGTAPGQTAYWNGTAWIVNTNIFNNGGNIGIGTTTPTAAKVVIGGAAGSIGLDLSTADQYANMRVLRNPSGDNDMYFGLGSAPTGADLKFYGNNTERMTINSGVGIGTTTPTQPLDVVGNVKFSGALMPNNTAGTTGQVLTSAGAGTAPTWTTPATVNTLYSADGTLAGNRVVTQGANTLGFTSTAVNGFSVDGTTMSVDAANNRVGIGTTTPAAQLSVGSSSGTAVSPAHVAQVSGNSIEALALQGSTTGTNLSFYKQGSATRQAAIASNVNALGSDIILYTTNTTGTADQNRMVIKADGNVGIGTTLPSERLDVIGNMKFTGALMPNNISGTVGQVLTSAGAGTAPTWTTPVTVNTLYSADGTLGGNRIVTQGANTLSFTGTAVNAFNVDAGTFSVDAANNRVGMGTSTPVSQLSVGSSSGTAVAQTNTALIAGNNIEALGIQGNTAGTNLNFYKQGSSTRQASVQSSVNASGSDLAFYTTSTTGTADQNRMIIKADGNVGIGTVTPSANRKLQVVGSTDINGTHFINTFSTDALTQIPVGTGATATVTFYTQCGSNTSAVLYIDPTGIVKVMSQAGTGSNNITGSGTNAITINTPGCPATFTYTFTVSSGIATIVHSGSNPAGTFTAAKWIISPL